jgi:hypothetical protein
MKSIRFAELIPVKCSLTPDAFGIGTCRVPVRIVHILAQTNVPCGMHVLQAACTAQTPALA